MTLSLSLLVTKWKLSLVVSDVPTLGTALASKSKGRIAKVTKNQEQQQLSTIMLPQSMF